MLNFEIAITNIQPPLTSSIVLKFGVINSILSLEGQTVNRSLLLQITIEEWQQMMQEYVFGLFIPNKRCFALASLATLTAKDRVFCHELSFFNEAHLVQYSCRLSLRFTSFKDPRVPQITSSNPLSQTGIHQHTHLHHTNTLNKTTNPQRPLKYRREQKIPHKPMSQTQIGGFKRSVSSGQRKNTQMMTRPLQESIKQVSLNKSIQNMKKIKHNNTISYQFEDYTPPMMEFTNQITPQIPSFQSFPQFPIQMQNNFQNSVSKGEDVIRREEPSAQNYTSTTTENPFAKSKQFLKSKKPVQKLLTRQELREMASEYNNAKKESVKVPIMRNGQCVLVPLYSMSKEQIIAHASMQKKAEEQSKKNAQLLKRVKAQEQERLKQQNERKKKSVDDIAKKNIERPNIMLSHPITMVLQQEFDHSYSQDFDSLSISKLSLNNMRQSRTKQLTNSKIRESEESYDMDDFENYSQSIISKSGNSYRPQKNSDISES